MSGFTGVTQNWINNTPQGLQYALDNGLTYVRDGLVLDLDAGNPLSYPGTGNTWTDLSGNGNNGTLVNGVGYTSSDGGSLIFDGVDDYVTLGTSLTNGYINITVSAWFYAVADTGRKSIVTKYPFVNGWLLYYSNDTSQFGVDGRESDAAYFNNLTTNTYPVDNWYNVVFTKNTTNWRLYVNSSLDCNNTNGNGTTSFNNAGILAIGSLPVVSEYVNGNISQVQIYNRALTPEEIQQNYNLLKGRYGL